MSEPKYTLKQFTDLNKGVNLLDFLIYLDNKRIVSLNKEELRSHKDNLLPFINELIKEWKVSQQYEFEEIQKAEEERKQTVVY